jgi:D-alanyl-D-alanine carboxypeptidase/D-alanyl-D-alanine-endopeptidase (penicillin-binding protein 4)
MLASGAIAVVALSLFPYALTINSQGVTVVNRTIISHPVPVEAQLSATPGTQEKTPEFDGAAWYIEHGETPETHGVLIESLGGERLFASHNSRVPFNPASLIKLSTTLVALKKLGADYRFQTRVFAQGQIDRAGILRGRILVTGEDPTFGDVGANMMANALRKQGIRQVTDGVIVSPHFCFNFSDSAEESGLRLVKSLHLIGSTEVGVGEGAPEGDSVCVLKSNALRDILLYMNARSSNFIAERVGASVGGPAGVQQFLIEDLGLPSDQVTIARTSGREHNRMTPRGLITVIRGLIEEANRQGLDASDIMPIASDDAGTLHRRLAGTGLEGAVVGKTGTLTSEVDGGMASLAGVVYTKDAGAVLFAILDQGNRISDHRQLEDQLLSEVVRSRSTPRIVASPTPRRLRPTSDVQIEGAQTTAR